MLVRFLLPLIIWIAIVFLLTLRVYEHPLWNWYGVTNYTIVQCVLLLVYAHIVQGILKKQLKYEGLRDKALVVAILSGLVFSVLIEVLRLTLGFNIFFNWINLFFNGFGVFLGIGTFRLVYRRCC